MKVKEESTAAHSALGQAPFSQTRGRFKTLFVLKLLLGIRSTRQEDVVGRRTGNAAVKMIAPRLGAEDSAESSEDERPKQ